MIERGERVTMQAIRVFLASRSKPYSLKADQISFALNPLRDQKKVDSFTNGKRVKVDKKTYHSIRQAARDEGVAIETVRTLIRSESPEFKMWHSADSNERHVHRGVSTIMPYRIASTA